MANLRVIVDNFTVKVDDSSFLACLTLLFFCKKSYIDLCIRLLISFFVRSNYNCL